MRTPTLLILGMSLQLLAAGCAAPGRIAEQQEIIASQVREIDSLGIAQERLRNELRVLQDSLQFYDDIDSGQYYRDMLALQDRIQRLEYDLAVSLDGGTTVAALLVDDLFEPASATLTEKGRAALDRAAERMNSSHAGRRFRVEGHSDSVPVGPSLTDRFPSNWELSSARASAVVRYLIEQHEFEPERLQVVSNGSTRPVSPNTTADGRRQNRRIRIAALPEALQKAD
jgi:chemotaxis protein MotB